MKHLRDNFGKHTTALFFLSLLICFMTTDVFAFRDVAHREINRSAVELKPVDSDGFSFDGYLKKRLGFDYGINEPIDNSFSFRTWSFQPITVEQIIRNGGTLDDSFPRYFRHFHDAIGNFGLWNVYRSAIIWAQLPEGQGYSWIDARHYYYSALTAEETYGRNVNFAFAFRSLGQVMHLVADMAVPEHTRNDSHPFSPGIEKYVDEKLKKDPKAFNNALGRPFFFDFKTLQTTASAFTAQGAPVPIANLFDRNLYSGSNPNVTTGNKIGLAEYSNANFLSTDTNPVDKNIAIPPLLTSTTLKEIEIPHPLRASEKINRWYYTKDRDGEEGIRNCDGEIDGQGCDKEASTDNGYKLTATSVLAFYRETIFGKSLLTAIPLLDDEVYEDYAGLLLPRAVGYAATALNYFFRGDIELSLPDQGFYAISTEDQNGFNQIRILARNVTVNDEEMPEGSVELVVRYKTALQDPFQGIPVPVSEDFSYIVAQEANGMTSIPQGSPIELVFNLPEDIPFNATDVTLQTVYHGKLGFQTGSDFVGETQGVGVGFLDISEPTAVDYINSMDVICFNGYILPAGDPGVLEALDAEGERISSYIDFFPHNIVDSYLKYSPQANISYASSINYDVTMSNVPAGHYARHFILTEPYGTYVIIDNQMQPTSSDSRDSFIHMPHRGTRFIQGMINQEIVEDGVRTRYYSGMSNTRGIKTWGGIHWVGQKYPSNSTCNAGDTSIPLAESVPVELNN